jgi:hypothetical protein
MTTRDVSEVHYAAAVLIPAETLSRWRTRARRGALMKLKSLLEFRELVDEFRAEAVLMQAYKEASESMLIAVDTLRDDMYKIRDYPADRLVYWLENGVSFDHLERAARLSDVAHKPPAQLLDEAIELGNETGQTMTAAELTSHAMSEVEKPMKLIVYRRTVIYNRLGKFPTTGFDDAKLARFNDWREAGREFLE